MWTKIVPVYLILIGLIIIGLALVPLFPRIAFSYHGDLNISLFWQIVSGHIPPNQFCLANLPLNYPWLHLLPLVAIYRLTGIGPLITNPLLNLALFLLFVLAVVTASKIIFSKKSAANLSIMLSLFGINLFGVLFWLHNLSKTARPNFFDPNSVLSMLSYRFDGRYSFFLNKFFNFTPYVWGIALVAVYFYFAVKFINKKEQVWVKLLPVYFFCWLLHPYSALFITIVLLPSLLLHTIINNKNYGLVLKIFVGHAVVGLTVLPYLLSISHFTVPVRFEPLLKPALTLILVYPLQLGILFLILLRRADKNFLKQILFYLCATLIGLLVIVLLRFDDATEYKFAQLLALPMSPLIVIYLEKYAKQAIYKISLVVFLLAFVNITILLSAYFFTPWARRVPLANFIGSYDLFEYLGSHSEPDDIVINTQDQLFDLREGYISKRQTFLASCSPHTDLYPQTEIRQALVNDLPDSAELIKQSVPGVDFFVVTNDTYQGLELLKSDGQLNLYKL